MFASYPRMLSVWQSQVSGLLAGLDLESSEIILQPRLVPKRAKKELGLKALRMHKIGLPACRRNCRTRIFQIRRDKS